MTQYKSLQKRKSSFSTKKQPKDKSSVKKQELEKIKHFKKPKEKRKRQSRRISQRKKQKQKINDKINNNNSIEQPLLIQLQKEKQIKSIIQQQTIDSNIKTYGFSCNYNLPQWNNLENVITSMTKLEYFHRPSQMAYHNLCTQVTPPQGIGITLGLGLKFCIQAKTPPTNLNNSFTRFIDDIHKRFIFAGQKQNNTPKKMYVKSTWKPEKTESHVEERLTLFMKYIQNEKIKIHRRITQATNLTTIQQQHIKLLKDNKNFIILNADKNLGPCIMERKEYIKHILNEHLNNTDTYQQLHQNDATKMILQMKYNCISILGQHVKSTTVEEKKFYTKQLQLKQRVPQFYGMPKMHKNKTPTPFIPVVSQCGSLSAIISKFIDYKLQPFTTTIPSYIKNSSKLLDKLDRITFLPKNARLFTSDATSMYTNIDPDEGIDVLKKYLTLYKTEIKESVNIEFICALTHLVMTTNVFQFGDTWWHQKIGTAMGTPCACIYATIFFAWFERQNILTKYKKNLLLYKRQIDDIFGIWIDDPINPTGWEDFKKDLNMQCKLDWNTEELNTTVNFLDLTISIDKQGKLTYQTFQKPMNPFLYIPGHSSHPPGIVKSLIHGLVQTYHRQNKSQITFDKNVRQLFKQLIARGHLLEDLQPIFLKATENIDRRNNITLHTSKRNMKSISSKSQTNERKDIFFHLPYHPRDISRKTLHRIYQNTCEVKDNLNENFQHMDNGMGGTMQISKLTIAYARGQNLRDVLCSSTLQEYTNCKVSNFLTH